MRKLLALVLSLYIFVITLVVGRRHSRGHIIIVGAQGGQEHQPQTKIVPIPIPYPMPCPIQHSPHQSKPPIIIRVPVETRRYHPMPIPVVQHMPQMPMFRRIPVFQKEIDFKDQYSMPEMTSFDSTAQHSHYDKKVLLGPPTQEGSHGQESHGQESRLNYILSKLRVRKQ